MKKFIVTAVLAVMLATPALAAAPPCPPPVLASAGAPASVLPAVTAVGIAGLILVANMEGVAFPACGDGWEHNPGTTGFLGAKCYGEYPQSKD